MRKLLIFIITASLALWTLSCANQIPLTGGPKDEQPPLLNLDQSTPNYQVQFDQRQIGLFYDEYINLQSPGKQIVVSPPLEYSPKIKSRLKKITIELDEREQLKDDVTYIINFGKSIRDFTEGNTVENFSFVFSTGDFIDSLSISGNVRDAKTQEPVTDVLVGLYLDHQDSIVYKERPFYFAHTIDGGRFSINNIRGDQYKVVGITDHNEDYVYDPDIEQIAFIDSLVVVNDSVILDLDLSLFGEERIPYYVSYEAISQGLLQLTFSGDAQEHQIHILDSVDAYVEANDQKLDVWFAPEKLGKLRFSAPRASGLDTITVRINQRSLDTIKAPYAIQSINNNKGLGIRPTDPLTLTMSRPTVHVDSALVMLIDTSTQDTIPLLCHANLPARQIDCDRPQESGRQLWQLYAMPGAFVDIFGTPSDTISKMIRWADHEEFGSIVVNVISDSAQHYVIHLYQAKERVAVQRLYPGDSVLRFEQLVSAKYAMEVIEDHVANGKWDPGDYLLGRQSEPIRRYNLGDLRANWVLEKEIDITRKQQGLMQDEDDPP